MTDRDRQLSERATQGAPGSAKRAAFLRASADEAFTEDEARLMQSQDDDLIHYVAADADVSPCDVNIMTTPYTFGSADWSDVTCPACLKRLETATDRARSDQEAGSVAPAADPEWVAKRDLAGQMTDAEAAAYYGKLERQCAHAEAIVENARREWRSVEDNDECPRCGGPLASDGVCANDSCGDEDDLAPGYDGEMQPCVPIKAFPAEAHSEALGGFREQGERVWHEGRLWDVDVVATGEGGRVCLTLHADYDDDGPEEIRNVYADDVIAENYDSAIVVHAYRLHAHEGFQLRLIEQIKAYRREHGCGLKEARAGVLAQAHEEALREAWSRWSSTGPDCIKVCLSQDPELGHHTDCPGHAFAVAGQSGETLATGTVAARWPEDSGRACFAEDAWDLAHAEQAKRDAVQIIADTRVPIKMCVLHGADCRSAQNGQPCSGMIASAPAWPGYGGLPAVPERNDDDQAWAAYCAALPAPTADEVAAVESELCDPYADQLAEAVELFKTAARAVWRVRASGGTSQLHTDLIASYRTNTRSARRLIEVYRDLSASWRISIQPGAERDAYSQGF